MNLVIFSTRRRLLGFTLVELLVSLTLASLLVVASLQVLRGLSSRHKLLLAEGGSSTWRELAADRLRFDLANARAYEWTPGRLRLTGFMAIDFNSGIATGRPCEVVYRVAAIANHNWLLREESQTDVLSSDNRQAECLCEGVDTITLELEGQSKSNQRRYGEVTGCFRVALACSGQTATVIDLRLCQ